MDSPPEPTTPSSPPPLKVPFSKRPQQAPSSRKTPSEPAPSPQPQQHQPKLKIVIRRLPANLPEELFWKTVEPWITEDSVSWKVYRKGKVAKSVNKETVHSRAYVLFRSTTSLVTFHREFDGHLFRDKQGNESNAVIEYAVYQKIPVDRKKGDRKQGSIETDPDYLSFLESLKAPVKTVVDGEVTSTSQAVATAAAAALGASSSVRPKLTPLLEHLKARKEGKLLKLGRGSLAGTSGTSTPRGGRALLAPPIGSANGKPGGKKGGAFEGSVDGGKKKDKGKGKAAKEKAPSHAGGNGNVGGGSPTGIKKASRKGGLKSQSSPLASPSLNAPHLRIQPPDPAALQAQAAAALAARQQAKAAGSAAQSPSGEGEGSPMVGASRNRRREKRSGGKKEGELAGKPSGSTPSASKPPGALSHGDRPPVQFKLLQREPVSAGGQGVGSTSSVPNLTSAPLPPTIFQPNRPSIVNPAAPPLQHQSQPLNPNPQVFHPQVPFQNGPRPNIPNPMMGRGGFGGGFPMPGMGGGGGPRGGARGGRGGRGGRGRGFGP